MGLNCCSQKQNRQYKKTMLDLKALKATYDIEKIPLGSGTFGTVYRAENKKNRNQKIAIKAIDKKPLS